MWPLTVTVFGLLVVLALLAHWCDRPSVAPTSQRTDSQESHAAVEALSRFARSGLLIAALLVSLLIGGDQIISQNKAVAREPMVIAAAATEFVHDRIRLELPRIITWRPLPVTPPELHRRARPHGAPTPNPKAG
jgi:hypothetical protein